MAWTEHSVETFTYNEVRQLFSLFSKLLFKVIIVISNQLSMIFGFIGKGQDTSDLNAKIFSKEIEDVF